MRIALLDSDVIAYRAAILNENDTAEQAIELVKRMTQVWTEVAECDDSVHCLSTSPSFRHKAWPDYKQNRKDKPKPKHLGAVYEFLLSETPCWYPEFEGDDIIGILATFPDPYDDLVIVTIDKDMDQIPGIHCNPDKEVLYTVSTDDADFYRWQQILSGDSADNYPGLRGIGDKKAAVILECASEGSREAVVQAAYESKGVSHLLSSMITCATILTYNKGVTCEQSLLDSTEAGTLTDYLRLLKRYST